MRNCVIFLSLHLVPCGACGSFRTPLPPYPLHVSPPPHATQTTSLTSPGSTLGPSICTSARARCWQQHSGWRLPRSSDDFRSWKRYQTSWVSLAALVLRLNPDQTHCSVVRALVSLSPFPSPPSRAGRPKKSWCVRISHLLLLLCV